MSADTSFIPNDFDIFEGTTLGQCYKVEALLGEGCFGFVTKCLNTKTNKAVAVKVNKNDPKILEQAKSEIFILEKLERLDPDSCNIIKWNGFFIDREHICLNFELLDQSLYDYMQDRNNQGLPVNELRPVLHQLTNALSHLSAIGIVHTDLKLDNVMVVDRHQSPIKVKVIDFGLASFEYDLDPRVSVQSFWYRAPEVMVHAPFDEAIDMWSLGLIAVELAIGCPLYPGEIEYDVFKYIIQTQGQPPDCVLDCGFCTRYFFNEENDSNQRWRFKCEGEFQEETGLQSQETRYVMMRRLDGIEKLMIKETGKQSGQDVFVSLIKEMLHLDANQRITPSEALRHPFFDPVHSQSSSTDTCIYTENTEDQSLVLSQQPSSWQSNSPHSIDCSVQSPGEFLSPQVIEHQAAAAPIPQPASAPEPQPSTSSELPPAETTDEIQQADAGTSGSGKRCRLDKKGRTLVKLEAENAVLLEEKEQLKAMLETAKEESEKAKAASEDKQRMYTEASLKPEQLEAALSNEKQQKIHTEKLVAQQLDEAQRQKEEMTEAQSELEEGKHEREQDRSRLLAEHSETTSVIKAAAMKAQEDLKNERSQWLQEKSSIQAAVTAAMKVQEDLKNERSQWLQEKSSILATVTALKQSLEEKDEMIADLMNKVKELEQEKKKTKKRSLWKRFVQLFRRS